MYALRSLDRDLFVRQVFGHRESQHLFLHALLRAIFNSQRWRTLSRACSVLALVSSYDDCTLLCFRACGLVGAHSVFVSVWVVYVVRSPDTVGVGTTQ